MKIELDKIRNDRFDVREDYDEDHVNQIAESLEEDGQWNPIIVRPSPEGNGTYDLIAGHTRCRAAERIGWDEIDATVKDVSDEAANRLALKTNLKRKGMSKLEEGKVINDLLTEHELTQSELAEKLGKSQRWVSERIKVALELDPKVKGLVQEGDLSYSIARIVTQVPEERQLEFAEHLLENDVTDSAEASKYKQRFLNDTLYTVGYQGRDFDEFASLLKENDVDILVDVRGSADSSYKPEFNGDVLASRLKEEGIDYRHEPEFGVHRLVRGPYKDGAIGHACVEDWYEWYINEEADVDMEEFTKELVNSGKPALMCIEHHPKPAGEQEIYCHRHFLADMIQSVTDRNRRLFPNRIDV